uniref:Uncharacterized protein n=1 Tax=Cacopsylla melanoneura TaxID=428564 RepID=A0A8D9FI58_9HEMI
MSDSSENSVNFNGCENCSVRHGTFMYWCNDESDVKIIEFLKTHGVLSDSVVCPRCNEQCNSNWNLNKFSCKRVRTIDKKRSACTYIPREGIQWNIVRPE